MIFPHGKGVQEQHYFLIWHPSICPSLYFIQKRWVEFNQTYHMTSYHGKGVQEWVHHSVHYAIINISMEHGYLQWAHLQLCILVKHVVCWKFYPAC